ncbi:MAG: glycosyltransferase [Phycisphaerales bacterium]|jgi:glycosyltransferase involved in cell wall biosynthesis
MNNQGNVDVLCFGGEDWWYHNQGHIDFQLMRRFSKMGTTLYVNSIVTQKPKLSEGRKFVKKLIRKTRSILTGLKLSDAGFWVYSPFSLPVHHVACLCSLNEMLLRFQLRYVMRKLAIRNPVVWVACPTACSIAVNMKKSKLVYQRTDCYEAYPNVDSEMIAMCDRKLKAEADITLFVNHSLYNEEAGQCKKAYFLDHGVDFDMFTTAEQNSEHPADIAGIRKPIAGYFGAIDDHKFDVGLVERLADLLPNVSFVFVGKTLMDCSRLSSKKNVWMLGQKPYEQIPNYGKYFDVAIFPWRVNSWTEAANPIKLKEYLALGKPIVSTPAFTELQEHIDVVYKADTPEVFVELIKKALDEDCPEKIAARREKVKDSTWDSKAHTVLKELLGRNGDF